MLTAVVQGRVNRSHDDRELGKAGGGLETLLGWVNSVGWVCMLKTSIIIFLLLVGFVRGLGEVTVHMGSWDF